MPKHLVLAGAGHANLELLRSLPYLIETGIAVTVIGPARQHQYSGMGPGVLGGVYAPRDMAFPVRDMALAGGARFVEDRVVRVDAPRRTLLLDSGDEIGYDAVSFNVGSRVVLPGLTTPPQNAIFPVKPIENLVAARSHVLGLLGSGTPRLAVAGGGPAALEVAGNLRRITESAARRDVSVTMYAGRRFLSHLPERVRALARENLVARGVVIDETGYVREVRPGALIMEDGAAREADVILVATGIRPPTLFADSGLPTGPTGGLAVDRFLSCPAHPEIFGGGDCIHFQDQPLAPIGVHAVRQAMVLAHNLPAALEGRPLRPFLPQKQAMLIYNLGDGTAILHRGFIAFRNALAFRLKNWIDRRFMRRYTPHD